MLSSSDAISIKPFIGSSSVTAVRKDLLSGAATARMERTIHGVSVRGAGVDSQTRCRHYSTARDVVAIQFECCRTFYCCHECHDASADHPTRVWSREAFDEPAVLCGVCGTRIAIADYLADGSACPSCDAAFNPGCRAHRHLYFETPDD